MKNLLIMSVIALAMGACSSAYKNTQDDSAKQVEQTETAESTTDGKDAKSATEAKSNGSDSRVVCTLDKDERIIDVRKSEAGGCELFYTKFGEEKSVASSGFGTQYCEEVRDRIQSNLTKAGFSCQ